MTFDEIISTMRQACEAIRRMPEDARPARLKAINIGYLHEADDIKDQEPVFSRRINSRNEIKLIEAAEELVKLERRPSHRRALWAWSMSKAGGTTFKRWCSSENIHVETGRRRAKDAIRAISARFECNTSSDNEINGLEVLIEAPKMGYNGDKMRRTWMDDEAITSRDCVVSEWQGIRKARNAIRRARYAR